jgi:hypothetical protein
MKKIAGIPELGISLQKVTLLAKTSGSGTVVSGFQTLRQPGAAFKDTFKKSLLGCKPREDTGDWSRGFSGNNPGERESALLCQHLHFECFGSAQLLEAVVLK